MLSFYGLHFCTAISYVHLLVVVQILELTCQTLSEILSSLYYELVEVNFSNCVAKVITDN